MNIKKYIKYGFLLSFTVLILTACAEPANRDNLAENYSDVLIKDDVKKYENEKKKESEKVERVSFLDNTDYTKNLESMILYYNSVADMVLEMQNYTSVNDTYLGLYNSLERNMKEAEKSAQFISKFNTEKIIEEEEEVLYQLKILSINIQENLKNQRSIFTNEKVITDWDSYQVEAKDREERLMNQYQRAMMTLEKYLASHNLTLKEYFNSKNKQSSESKKNESDKKEDVKEEKKSDKKESSKKENKEDENTENPASNIQVNVENEE